jgi:hypothetical protein
MASDADYSPKYDEWSKDEYPPDWENRSRIVRTRDNHRCQNCGSKYLPENDVSIDVDHITPKSEGGSHSLDNLQTLCRNCHARKHPNNEELARRADTASQSLIVALFMIPIRILAFLLGGSEEDRISEISTTQQRTQITAEVDQLWDPNHDSMQQVGLLTDGDDAIKFTSWKNNEVKQVQEGTTYEIRYASVDEYEGEPQLELDTYSEIQRVG